VIAELIDANCANGRELFLAADELTPRNRKPTFFVRVSSKPSLHPEPNPIKENGMSRNRRNASARWEQFAPVRVLRVNQFSSPNQTRCP
jgi:hypothetical protein